MSEHLDASELELAAQGRLTPDARAHLESCESCRSKVPTSPHDAETNLERASPGGHDTVLRDAPPAPSALAPEKPQQPEPEHTPFGRGDTVGRYLVLSKLGQGGMGVVYAAYDQELDRKVAVKLLRPERSGDGHARLLREAQAMARVSHPNVLPVFDVGTLGDRVFVAMEFVDGGTLKQWLKEKHTWREVLQIFLDAGRGLAAAHDAGLVHRDFKPENVLIGKDGRVFVTDFGLARLVSGARAPEDAQPVEPGTVTGSRLSSPLTQAGAVMGTPRYMAPEQYLGPEADARTDEFAFCSALYWGLWRKRPFDPQKIAAAAALTGDESTQTAQLRSGLARRRPDAHIILEPPSQPKVPGWLRAAVLRGLSLSADARYPSMHALLTELERRSAVKRRGYSAAAAAALVLASAVGVVGYREATARAQRCSGGTKRVAAVWDAAARAALEKAFVATGAPAAADQAAHASAMLDRYAEAWAAMHRDACEAARVREEEPEKVLALRMACLDRRLQELHSLVGLFETADAKMVNRAVEAAQNLSSIRPCANVATLLERAPMPDDPAERAKIDAEFQVLADVNATRIAGRYPQALEKVSAAWQRIAPLHYRPLEAEALYLRGTLEDVTGKETAVAEASLVLGYTQADAGRDDALKAQIANRLMYVLGQHARLDDALRWNRAARAALERLGGNRELEVEVLINEGSARMTEGHNDEAVATFQQALKLTSLELGPDDPRRLIIQGNLANALAQVGRDAEAIPILEGVLEEIERIRGPGHPTSFNPRFALAAALWAQRRFGDAHVQADLALELARTRFGPTHVRVPTALDLKASIYQEEERYEEAIGTYRAALAIQEKIFPPNSPELSFSLDGIGQCLVRMKREREALPYLERALELRGPDPLGRADTQFALARALWETRGDRARALKLADEAKANYARASRPTAAVDQWLSGRPR